MVAALFIAREKPSSLDLSGCCPRCFTKLILPSQKANVAKGLCATTAYPLGALPSGSTQFTSEFDDIIDIGQEAPSPSADGVIDIGSRGHSSQYIDHTKCTLKDWLHDVDSGHGHLISYLDVLEENYDSAAQVVSLYAQQHDDGTWGVDPKFFEDNEVARVGHRRLFQKWFAEALAQ
eukprot:gnl/MRDRNA2_/MRDRNA2_175193_c0_seq1.p1 gnl/MRDRNA2_/MRDRNA2_175193_c0~~gnl/MRDRNA2_/MRDRNA2_175193_c0_seq1.p1  ORF type:complete len:177 (-),score=32.94 gnl/MRDRNA2_/MRDRNA2_175193_c0_seq1:85-615(-)